MRPGRAADHSPTFLCRSHGRVELYLYPPSGPHRACNGITLPLPYIYIYIYIYIFTTPQLNQNRTNVSVVVVKNDEMRYQVADIGDLKMRTEF